MIKTKLDDKDKKILALVMDNPDISQKEIGDRVKLSQPSVALRLKRLKEDGFIDTIIGMNLAKVGFHIAKVEVTAKNPTKIINEFKNCPFFINALITSGKTNLCLFFANENVSTLQAIVDFRLRSRSEVQSVDFSCVIATAKSFIIPLQMDKEKFDINPCGSGGIMCDECPYYGDGRCQGCPARGKYRGKLFS